MDYADLIIKTQLAIHFPDLHIYRTRCVYETQMPPRVTNSIESHAYIKAFEK
jgi:hypothetical protein